MCSCLCANPIITSAQFPECIEKSQLFLFFLWTKWNTYFKNIFLKKKNLTKKKYILIKGAEWCSFSWNHIYIKMYRYDIIISEFFLLFCSRSRFCIASILGNHSRKLLCLFFSLHNSNLMSSLEVNVSKINT